MRRSPSMATGRNSTLAQTGTHVLTDGPGRSSTRRPSRNILPISGLTVFNINSHDRFAAHPDGMKHSYT